MSLWKMVSLFGEVEREGGREEAGLHEAVARTQLMGLAQLKIDFARVMPWTQMGQAPSSQEAYQGL